MKILLTAPPKTGKSTIVQKFVEMYPGRKVGVVAREMRDENNERVGFKNVNLEGKESVFMHVRDIESEILVGNKYKIDVKAIDTFVVPEITQEVRSDAVVIIDEIGRAQSYSSAFLDAVTKLFDSDKNILATIVYDDEPWAVSYKIMLALY